MKILGIGMAFYGRRAQKSRKMPVSDGIMALQMTQKRCYPVEVCDIHFLVPYGSHCTKTSDTNSGYLSLNK